jgi:hypothetical protein
MPGAHSGDFLQSIQANNRKSTSCLNGTQVNLAHHPVCNFALTCQAKNVNYLMAIVSRRNTSVCMLCFLRIDDDPFRESRNLTINLIEAEYNKFGTSRRLVKCQFTPGGSGSGILHTMLQ